MRQQAGPGAPAQRSGTFGTWLRHERRRLDLTQSELAHLSGCASITLKKIEADQLRPSKSLAGSLARSLQIPSDAEAEFIHFARLGQAPAIATQQSGPAWYVRRWQDTLPMPLARLIGRQQETERIELLLLATGSRRAAARLLTLTGPGGVGKTSLAVETVARLRDHFPQGIFFVDLSPLTDAKLVVATVVQTIGLKGEGQGRREEVLINFLYDKHVLLVLDNFEHLLPAAPHIATWLHACERLQVLVTSREALHLRCERQFHVRPLAISDPADVLRMQVLPQSPALELLVERAQEVRPDFRLTVENVPAAAELCARLDGLPLAIELAAAQTRYLTPQEILARLKGHQPVPAGSAPDLPARQRTISTTISWSYSLLSTDEKVLFRRLAVFAGSFTPTAAEAVVSLPGPAMVELLGRLVEKSLLQVEERDGWTRYRLLETVREFAHERLAESGEEVQTNDSHLNYFTGLAMEGGEQVHGPAQIEWIKRLNLEIDNFRAAVQWAQEGGRVEQGLRLISSAWAYWLMRGNLNEAKEWALSLLPQLPGRPELLALRAGALFTAAQMTFRLGERAALPLFEQSIACAEQAEDGGLSVLAAAQTTQAVAVHRISGSFEDARQSAEQAIRSARATGNAWLIAGALNNLGISLVNHGEYQAGNAVLRESLTFAEETGDRRTLGIVTSNLGYVCLKQADYGMARTYMERSLSLFVELQDPYDQYPTLLMMTEIELCENNAAGARERLGQCQHLWLDMGLHRGGYLIALGRLRLLEGEQQEARRLIEEGLRHAKEGNKLDALRGLLTLSRLDMEEGRNAQGVTLTLEVLDLVEQTGGPEVIAESLELLAVARLKAGRPEQAARLLGAAEALRGAAGVPMPPSQRDDYELLVTSLRTRLGDARFGEYVEEGRALSLGQAKALAAAEA